MLKEAQQRLRQAQVEQGGQRAALPHTCLEEGGVGEVAVDEGCRLCARQQQVGPAQEAVAKPKLAHDCQQEAAVDGVVGLAKIAEHHQGPALLPPQQFWQQLEEVDILADAAAAQEGCLLGADNARQVGAQAPGQHLGEEAVVGVEQGDGAVVGGVAGVVFLV